MGAHRNRKRILIVDDEEIIAVVLAAGLSHANQYDVDTATSGQAALDKLKAAPFDLVLTDYRMPGMDGIELSEKIRQLWPDALIILMTGFDSQQMRQKAQELNLYEYILKPTPMAEVQAIVEKALAQTLPENGKPDVAVPVNANVKDSAQGLTAESYLKHYTQAPTDSAGCEPALFERMIADEVDDLPAAQR
jgi:CheY-like chemotaxis protein